MVGNVARSIYDCKDAPSRGREPMKAPDEVARLLALVHRDYARRTELFHALLREVLWFPIEYHPELGNPYEPPAETHIPFWIGKDATGAFVPLFSSPKLMRQGLQRFTMRHSRARMKGSELFAVLARRGHAVRINLGAAVHYMMPAEDVRELADGTSLAPPEPATALLKMLPPEAWPPAWRQTLAEDCEAQPGVIAVWLCTATETSRNLAAEALHVVVWTKDSRHTPIDEILHTARLAFPEQKLEFVRLDEEHHADALAVMRKSPPVFPRPVA